MKKIIIKYILPVYFLSVFSGCFGDLDTIPIDPDVLTSENFYQEEGAYKAVLAKIYAGLAVTGQEGPAGNGDLSGIDEGFSSYLRQYWYQQELTTDEAVIGWADATIKDFHAHAWTPSDVFVNAFYNRVFYQIGVCNEFLRQTEADDLDRRNVDASLRAEIEKYRYEARFMRALSYWHALDEFRNVPFVTEEDPVGAFTPDRIVAADLYDYIESELLDIEDKIISVRANEYGRADQGAVWMLLGKLYLNANQYIGVEKNNECLTYCEKVINGGYSLEPEFEHLFLADNDHLDEVVFPIVFDGVNTKTWGGTTFIIRAGLGGILDAGASGVKDGWGGTRTTKQIVEKFGEVGGIVKDFYPRENKVVVYIPGNYQGNTINKLNTISDGDGDGNYEGYHYFDQDDASFVFALNPTLSGAYGDNDIDGKADIGGSPIAIGPAGFYWIQFNKSDKTYTIEERNWVASGSALDSDVPFQWDAETGMLKLETTISAGDMIFRSGSVVLGDNENDGVLDYDGTAISIESSGPVEMFLDLRVEEYIFKIASTSYDRRGIFGIEGQNLEIDDISLFSDGYAVLKFKNVTSTGEVGSNNEHPDTDFPMFRLADAYLMASEAILRGANGSKSDAVDYFNIVRSRAFKSNLANLDESTLNLQEIIDERARELMWEGHRRTDLIRFGQFTTADYLWAWKGGVKEGQASSDHRNIFPIPNLDLGSNPNLEQNPGY